MYSIIGSFLTVAPHAPSLRHTTDRFTIVHVIDLYRRRHSCHVTDVYSTMEEKLGTYKNTNDDMTPIDADNFRHLYLCAHFYDRKCGRAG